jgi:hypothetical protein
MPAPKTAPYSNTIEVSENFANFISTTHIEHKQSTELTDNERSGQ